MNYPEPKTVDWKDLATKAKTVLLARGSLVTGTSVRYEDDFIWIDFDQTRNFFVVGRKAMPDHPKEHLRKATNPFYMEDRGECIRIHGEGIHVYQHILDLAEAV